MKVIILLFAFILFASANHRGPSRSEVNSALDFFCTSHRARERSSQCERDCTTECRKCHYDDGFCKEDAAHNKMCYCYDRTPDGFRFEEVPLCSILVGVLRLLDGLLSGLLGGL